MLEVLCDQKTWCRGLWWSAGSAGEARCVGSPSICLNKDVPGEYRGVRFGLSSSSLHWEHCFLSEVQRNWWWGDGQGMASPCFLLHKLESPGLLLFGKLSQISEQPSLFRPRFPSSCCPYLVCAWHFGTNRGHSSPVFYFWCVAGIQNSKP